MVLVAFVFLIVNVVKVFATDLEDRSTTNTCSPSPCVHGSCFSSASNNFTCVCDGDFTGQNCDTPIYALECYSCQNIKTPSTCNQTQKCTSGQSCFMEATATVNGIFYRMGCQPSTMCSAQGHSPRIVSRFIEQPEQTNCHECCPGNLCNDHLCTRSIIRDCSDLLNSARSWPSGVYTMDTWETHTQVDVFCDMDTDGGGWTVFQHRVDGSVDFFKNFSSYENGFGDLHGDFWLGLRYLNEMTSRRKNTLRIELRTPNATRLYDVYEEFSVGSGSNYTLHVGKRVDSLNLGSTYLFSPYHDGMAFTTYDHDMDQSSVSNCASDYHGAWWYKSCYNANLNGQYFVPGTHNGTGITYNSFKFLISLKESKMMFK